MDGDAGGNGADEDADTDGDGVDDDDPLGLNDVADAIDVNAVIFERLSDHVEADVAKSGGDDAGDDATHLSFDNERSADKTAVGADEFHHVDFFATGVDGHADGVEDDENRDDEEDDGENDTAVFRDVGPVGDGFDFGAVNVVGWEAIGVNVLLN